MNAIVQTTAPLNYGDLERLANSIAKSGLFGIKTPDQAMALMMIAAAEGRHPALAARDYDIVNGRPTKKAEAMLRDFIQAGGKVEWHALTDELADATFTHPQTGSVRIDWDMKRATTAFGKKDMYSKFPRQMLRSRVVSEGVRTLWPLATSGFYVAEEVGNLPPHNGPTIDHDAEVEAPSPPPNSLRAVAATVTRPARKVAPPVQVFDSGMDLSPLDEPNGPKWLINLELLTANAQTDQEMLQIGDHDSVRNVGADPKAPDHVKQHVSKLLSDGYKRVVKPAPRETPDDLAIEGEQYAAAG